MAKKDYLSLEGLGTLVDEIKAYIAGLLSGKADTNHTHKYAGSSTAGGSATSAVKLDTASAGSATQPVYFADGKPVKTTYTLGKSVPSDAKFTDTTYTLNSFGITATAAELNKMDGVTATTTELNYVDGVTSNIQTQLNGKAASSHGNHVPATETADNAKFLRNDNTWQTVTPANIGAAASSHNHTASNITSGTLAVARGGTGVTSNPSMLVNLDSTSAASVFAASPRPGVTGSLGIGNGGTNATTAADARTNLGFTYGTEVPTEAPSTGDGSIYFFEDELTPVAITEGGTGATDATTALANLGITDYIVEQGTSGIWTYRKWASGIAECWGRHTETKTNYTTAGTLYGYYGTITYPFTFAELPVFNYNVQVGSGFAMPGSADMASSTSSTNWYALATASGSQNCRINITVHGRWK